MNAPLPPNVASLLQDEAYATLCRDSLTEELEKIQSTKARILTTRPPFGVLASSQTRSMFRTSLRAALDNEAGLQGRLDQITQVDAWLKHDIDEALQAYLPSGSVDYRCCFEANQVVTEWEGAIAALHELSLALARDAHALDIALRGGTKAPMKPSVAQQTRTRATNNLRTTVLTMQGGVAAVQAVRAEFRRLCDAQADGLQLPEPPNFPDATWVDGLANLSENEVCLECQACEKEARAFCATGMHTILRGGGEVREACADASRAILAKYWRQLRAHAQTHYVKEREVDEVLAELNTHRITAENARRQASFESASMAPLR
ncbi:MAG: hypothetical protein ABI222_00775 [Opitutaceae bacterium]